MFALIYTYPNTWAYSNIYVEKHVSAYRFSSLFPQSLGHSPSAFTLKTPTHTHTLSSICVFQMLWPGVEICMSRQCFWLSNDPQLFITAHTQTHKHARLNPGRGVERGAWVFKAETETDLTESSTGQIILSSLSLPRLTESPSAMMWFAWLYSMWSVVVSVGAIFIITIIHLRTSHLQVLLWQACRMLFLYTWI